MEMEVNKLELMFQKADSDLDHIQCRLEYDKTNHPDSTGQKNSVMILKELSVINPKSEPLQGQFLIDCFLYPEPPCEPYFPVSLYTSQFFFFFF
uniref:Ska2 N-terminal domain-containing protein n=1 Tax=Sciurus vulgaris TaxID=55149 RepID=A0A8D2D8Q3_SCIVU